MKNRPDLAYSLFLIALAGIVLGLTLLLGLYSGVKRNIVYKAAAAARHDLTMVLTEVQNFLPDGRPVHFLQPARHEGTGVINNDIGNDGNLVFITGFIGENNGLTLIERDGTVLAHWIAKYSEHFPISEFLTANEVPRTDRNVDIHGALMLPDGSVVFNYERAGTLKLSRCGDVMWRLKSRTHHSVELASNGGFWIPGSQSTPRTGNDGVYAPLSDGDGGTLKEDLILHVSEDGEITKQISLLDAFYNSGLEALLTSSGYVFTRDSKRLNDFIHSNKVMEVSPTQARGNPVLNAGDLVVSSRNYNMIFALDPKTDLVKWHKIGPWIRQHDPEFTASGMLSVFNNNTYQTDMDTNKKSQPQRGLRSTIVEYDFNTDESRTVYGGRPGQEFHSVIRGKLQPTASGGNLVTEAEAGHIFEIDADGNRVWQYLNRYDDDEVLELTEARLYPKDFFTVDDWSCP